MMTQQNPMIDGRTKRALDMAIARRQVSQESYRAVLAGTLTLQEAKTMGRDGAPATTPGSTASSSATCRRTRFSETSASPTSSDCTRSSAG